MKFSLEKIFVINTINLFKNKIENEKLEQSKAIALYIEIGTLVAEYNCYTKDTTLSKKNSTDKKIRIVFKKNIGKEYYLSLDVESGGFEVFDHNLIHLGQYNFNGERVKPATPKTHKLLR